MKRYKVIAIFFCICSFFLLRLNASENVKVVHPNFIQFVVSRLNPSFSDLFKLGFENRATYLNQALGMITHSSWTASYEDKVQVYYYTFSYSNESDQSYSIKCYKLQNKGYNAHVAIQRDSDGLKLYNDLLILFNSLEFIRPILDRENVSQQEFHNLFLKGCYQYECRISSFYVTENGLKWLENINKLDTRYSYKKRVDVGYEKWVELHAKDYIQTSIQIWNQIFPSRDVMRAKP
ncbi:MAG: hypothetical protein RJA04_1350 [Bacteroidota bacterium]|jgi:hypothetical protein